MCDTNKRVIFEPSKCFIHDLSTNEVFFEGERKSNMYVVNTNTLHDSKLDCLAVIEDTTNLWHRRMRHLNLRLINHLHTHNLVKGLPKRN